MQGITTLLFRKITASHCPSCGVVPVARRARRGPPQGRRSPGRGKPPAIGPATTSRGSVAQAASSAAQPLQVSRSDLTSSSWVRPAAAIRPSGPGDPAGRYRHPPRRPGPPVRCRWHHAVIRLRAARVPWLPAVVPGGSPAMCIRFDNLKFEKVSASSRNCRPRSRWPRREATPDSESGCQRVRDSPADLQQTQ